MVYTSKLSIDSIPMGFTRNVQESLPICFFLKTKNINSLYILGIQMKYSKNMIIGIDLNGVLRDLNKQINVCWEKKHGTPYIEDENDIKNHDLKSEIKWNSIQERNEFFFEEYPFELFGCTPCMSNYCVFKVNDWYKESEYWSVHLNMILALWVHYSSVPNT